MPLQNLSSFLMLLLLPTLLFAQPADEQEEIEFAFVDDVNGDPGDALFLKEAKYQNTYQYKVANEVFEALIDARGDFRMQKPTFKMTKSERNVAVAKPRKGEIMLEMKAYEVCSSFGEDSLNAIAALLSHELIHYYEKHQFSKHFAAENQGTSTGKELRQLNERLKLETQSDYLGGFLAYSAGYQTLNIMPQFLDKVYKSYHLKDTLRGYPPLSERKKLAINALEKLQSFLHVFEMANYLTALQQYEQAKLYFDYILKDYQSREIYNNVGVIAAQVGMQFVDDQLLKFGLPLELDVETRLKSGTRGTKEDELGVKVLEEAIEYFEKASQLDENYPIALLNTACTHMLLNNFDDAEYFARKALKLCNQPKWDKTKSDVFVLQGILADFQNDPEKAANLFQRAIDAGNNLAVMNLKVLKKESPTAASQMVSANETQKDQIDNFSIDKAVVQLLQGKLNVDQLVNINNNTMCGTMRLEHSTLLIHFVDENNFTFVQTADESYSGETKLGIATGDSGDDILHTYKQPDRRLEVSTGRYWTYFNSNLLFQLNGKNEVQVWSVFRKKESKN